MRKFLLIFIPIIVVVGIAAYIYFAPELSPPSEPGPPLAPPKMEDIQARTTVNPSEEAATVYGKAMSSPPEPDYTTIELALLDPETGLELTRTRLAHDGSYSFTVAAGEYIMDFASGSPGKSPALPRRFYLAPNDIVQRNFFLE